jgi:hypothetical protein
MTLTSRGRLATVIVAVVLAFAAAFVVGRASAGSRGQQPTPARVVPSKERVKIRGLTLPSTLPALRQKPREGNPSSPAREKSNPSSAPTETTSPSVTPHSSPSPSGGGGGKVVVG